MKLMDLAAFQVRHIFIHSCWTSVSLLGLHLSCFWSDLKSLSFRHKQLGCIETRCSQGVFESRKWVFVFFPTYDQQYDGFSPRWPWPGDRSAGSSDCWTTPQGSWSSEPVALCTCWTARRENYGSSLWLQRRWSHMFNVYFSTSSFSVWEVFAEAFVPASCSSLAMMMAVRAASLYFCRAM